MSIIKARWLIPSVAMALSACSAGKPPYQFTSNEPESADVIHGSNMQNAKGEMHGANPPHDKTSMVMPSTGDPDTDFLRGMIPHHEGAVEMARAEIATGTDPKIRAMAEEVIRNQQAEIATMQTWLAERQAAGKGS
ncbi:hypothetical protein ASE82_17785 [Sphingomonas sp. Leaf230]|uniref:CopM family metallochaperone n=1 Tax=Sphingomonas sp. Leaf230 TaxID=1735694 RepID=UPI0006F4CF98|nr:DUF305 domain-containing protein [Sphingomonas sp. Leaf230]KQN00203.1 hypothetical protein ASE82_17785 [Sphingomonas sp. Leaf230]